MTIHRVPPAWRLPEGVNLALWEYLHTPRLAVEEDAYFAEHPLFRSDTALLDARFQTPGRLVDLGCGAGRHALRFASRGFPVVAIDLSRTMLETVLRKAVEAGISTGAGEVVETATRVEPSLLALQANLCHLECLPDGTFDYALSMFSTLGMIRTPPARRKALGEAYRILRKRGRLAIHVHNLFLNLRDPQGRRWLLTQLGRLIARRADAGDRRMTYRGIPNMEVHLYRWGEFRRALRRAGFVLDEVVPLQDVSYEVIDRPWLLPSIRAGGWIVFATKT